MATSVFTRLRDAIVAGEYSTGEPLTESALAHDFGVSRTPVREALRRLEKDGLIERGHRGLQVRAWTPEEILEIYGVRILIEPAAAREAATKRTILDLRRLQQLHQEMCSADMANVRLLVDLNRRFHEALWAASHNSTLVDLLTMLEGYLVRFREPERTTHKRWEDILREHAGMLEAIEDRDPDRAESQAREHMERARNTRLQAYASDAIR